LSKSVDNDIFRKPAEFGGELISGFTRKNLLAVMLNLGTKENIRVLTGGYKLSEDAIRAWVDRHATEQDWNTVKAVWKVFADLKSEGDTMYRSIGSFGISSKRGVTFQTPFGEVEGGYYPLIRNSEFGGTPKAVREGLFENNYTAATPPASYTKRVTGAVYPLELNIDALPNRLMQEIHDISMRPALIDAAKVFLDTGVRNTISAHFGPEMADLLKPYLRDLANRANNIPGVQGPVTELLGSLRHNLITSIVGLGTFAKHTPTAFVASMGDVPPGRFLKALVGLVGNNLETGEKNFRFAMENSNELPRRKFNAEETIHGATGLTFGQSKLRTFQQTVREWSSKPYMLGDLLSAVPLWNAKYEMGREAGLSHGDAVHEADRAVQRAHGSTLITNRPAVVRNSNPWFTSLYNFYSNMVNRHMEAVWRAGEEVGAANSPYALAKDKVLDIAGRTFAYAIWPAVIEQLVSPIGGQNDSWEKKAALALGGQFASGWVGIRDLAGALIRGDDPSAGLTGTGYEYGTQAFKDLATALSKGTNPRRTRAIINSAINLGGLFTGMVPAPLGNLAKFEYGVATGAERPVGLWSWLVGTRFGTLKHHSSTFRNYLEGRPY
jgi:hypothetical protein